MTDDLYIAVTDINSERERLQAAVDVAEEQLRVFDDNVAATVANLRAALPQPAQTEPTPEA